MEHPDLTGPRTDNVTEQEARWPAVARAYDFVLPSYQWMVQRYEAADGRLTHVITFASTALFSAPVLARAIRPEASVASPLFLAALACLATAALGGIVFRQRGRLRLINPMTLYEGSLHVPPWEFQKDMLYYAGQDFRDNARVIEAKAKLAAVLTALIVVGLVLLVARLFI